jgi:hypothetical protein
MIIIQPTGGDLVHLCINCLDVPVYSKIVVGLFGLPLIAWQ